MDRLDRVIEELENIKDIEDNEMAKEEEKEPSEYDPSDDEIMFHKFPWLGKLKNISLTLCCTTPPTYFPQFE